MLKRHTNVPHSFKCECVSSTFTLSNFKSNRRMVAICKFSIVFIFRFVRRLMRSFVSTIAASLSHIHTLRETETHRQTDNHTQSPSHSEKWLHRAVLLLLLLLLGRIEYFSPIIWINFMFLGYKSISMSYFIPFTYSIPNRDEVSMISWLLVSTYWSLCHRPCDYAFFSRSMRASAVRIIAFCVC